MILGILKYYAQFPDRNKVLEIFAKGRSDLPEYEELRKTIEASSDHSRIPGLDYYIFGQSFDSVKQRVDLIITGIYLFVEVGDIQSSRDNRNCISDSIRMAVTIAAKTTDTDLAEEAIQSDRTLSMVQQLRALMISDQQKNPWLKELSDSCELKPFVAKEFASIGWTLTFDRQGSDLFELKRMISSFRE